MQDDNEIESLNLPLLVRPDPFDDLISLTSESGSVFDLGHTKYFVTLNMITFQILS